MGVVMDPPKAASVLFALLLIFVASRIHKFLAGLKSVGYLPGMRIPFAPLSVIGSVALPTTWWNPGNIWFWKWRKTAYMNRSVEIISAVPFIGGQAMYYTGSLNVVKQLLANEGKTRLEKPLDMSAVLLQWGENIFSANGDVWKRHRRIIGPAFTSQTYALVVKETLAAYRELLEVEGWQGKQEIIVKDFNRIPLKLTFTIIVRCGFGLPMPWADEHTEGNVMSVGEALQIVLDTSILRLVLPSWMYRLPIQRLRTIDVAWKFLLAFMHESVSHRKQELVASGLDTEAPRGDIFSRLVAAYDDDDSKYRLEKEEVIGNTFIMMFAGHETTAHVLSATFGFLAIHQQEQDKAIAEINTVIPGDRDLTIDDLQRLPHLLACFQEAIRMFPAGVLLIRDTTEDIALRVSHPTEQVIPVSSGSRLVIDMVGVHHDPHVFPDPDKYIPSRWYGMPEHDVSMFGFGPRACIGRKFAHTEALCFLTAFLRDWKLDIILEEGDTREKYEERVLESGGRIGLIFGVGSLTFKLTRRSV